MTENEMINGWTFEETIKTAENLMENESNMFKWDVLRHLRDFAENYKEEVQAYRAIGTVEECRVAVEKMKPKKPSKMLGDYVGVCRCGKNVFDCNKFCSDCGQAINWNKEGGVE